MNNKQTSTKSKIFNLKKWLLVPEAARYLSILFNEEVCEADVLRLALDKHLTLSVDFVNYTYVRRGKIVSEEDTIWEEFPMSPDHEKIIRESSPENVKLLDGSKDKIVRYMKSLNIDDKRFINLDEKVTRIGGVWDLSMIGNERLDIEHKFQMLTGGPEVTLQGLDGAFVESKDGRTKCQLQESFDQNEYTPGSKAQLEEIKERIASNNIGEEQSKKLLDQYKKNREEYLKARKNKNQLFNYYPAGGLPRDSVLVVRTQALIDLQERLSQADSRKYSPLDSRSETTYLNIIGAMLETFIHRSHGDVDFPSEAKLREFFGKKYAGFKGLTERTLAEKFAAAKRAINEDMD